MEYVKYAKKRTSVRYHPNENISTKIKSIQKSTNENQT